MVTQVKHTVSTREHNRVVLALEIEIPDVGLRNMAKSVITICFFISIDVDNYHNIYLTIIIMLNLQF